ncbi:hypothetical protein [Algoriphagus yeomjeoni]|uniref:Uncharacterized protein n=1 Tax=Algoriphagus yeomjeoni TaxID=291403 RepID=A0A327PLL0_9BACT|nr:hypothetical protein [Algoriphagus yeomjeoni]RAI92174.1 hypothetical protein LV83_01403 [Algoriphagus yeomjeoni]
MERSIENIWKEGFLKSDALIAPKINDLYAQKSIHIIDKFTRMFRINLKAIVVFSFVFLLISYLVGIPIMGIIFFVTLMVLVVINRSLLKSLETIDKGENSYEYLKKFNHWINKQVEINKRIAMFLYPISFMSIILGLWFKDAEGMFLGERLVNKIMIQFPEIDLLFGIPTLGIAIVLLILGLLAFFSGRIYMWDLNLVYGRVFNKMKELMSDLETLNN